MALASLAPGYFIEPNSHSSIFNSSKPCSSPYYADYKLSCRKCRSGATATPPGSCNEQKVSSLAAVARKKWQRRFSCNSLFGSLNLTCRSEVDSSDKRVELINRRQVLLSSLVGSVAASLPNAVSFLVAPPVAAAASSRSEFADMPALRGKDYGKTRMRYPDYTETETGLQFKDLRTGTGPTPKIGETVVVDWDGYTIGYYGRIFEARNKTKGGSFEGDDKNFFKFKIGSHEVIPAFEEAVSGMTLGGIRRIIVPPELGYPDNDYNKKGPRPTTFSGQRALDFVLRNQGLIDKTLLFDIELMKIIPN